MSKQLIILAKNPVLGKAKTRLAATVGNKIALNVYAYLLEHTNAIAQKSGVPVHVFFTDELEEGEIWGGFQQHLQKGYSLGDRMYNSLLQVGTPAVIIGTDCFDLSEKIIQQAFIALENHDVVIGPAEDGGYYLIGMNTPQAQLFKNKKWSTDSVFIDTIEDIKTSGLTHFILPTLTDIDTEENIYNSSFKQIYEQLLFRNHKRSI